jgi:hypothetical protein
MSQAVRLHRIFKWFILPMGLIQCSSHEAIQGRSDAETFNQKLIAGMPFDDVSQLLKVPLNDCHGSTSYKECHVSFWTGKTGTLMTVGDGKSYFRETREDFTLHFVDSKLSRWERVPISVLQDPAHP